MGIDSARKPHPWQSRPGNVTDGCFPPIPTAPILRSPARWEEGAMGSGPRHGLTIFSSNQSPSCYRVTSSKLGFRWPTPEHISALHSPRHASASSRAELPSKSDRNRLPTKRLGGRPGDGDARDLFGKERVDRRRSAAGSRSSGSGVSSREGGRCNE